MDINAADIAALEKILHWAEDMALQEGEEKPADTPQEAAPPAEEMPPEDLPAEDEELTPESPKPSVIARYEIGGGSPMPEEKKPMPGKKGRY